MALGVIVVPEEKPFIKALESYTAKFSNLSSGKNTVAIGLDTRNATKALGQISGNVKNFEASLAASNARVIAFGASTAVLGGVIAGFKELANATVEVEKSLTDVNRVFGLTSAGLQKLSTDLFEVSKITASSFKDASQALLEFSRQGVPAAEALQRTKDALTLTRLAGVETGAAVESLTAAVNGFSASGLNTTQILNKLVAVEQNYAVSAGDLSEALSRTGQAAQEAGVDINQLNALVTAAQQNTARGGAVIGNALKTIFTRIQRGGTLDQLEAFNVTVRDTAGNVLPAVEILKNFAAVYKDLGTSQKSQLSEQIAGIYQVNILKALIKDLNSENSVYAGSLEIGANATNEAEVATAKLNSTLSALFSRVGTGSTQLLNNIGKVTFDPLVRSASSVVEQVLDVFNKTLEGDGAGSFFANGLLKGIRNILGGPAAVGAFFALSNIIKTSFSYVAEIAPRLVGITTEASKRRDIEASVLAILQQESAATAILSDSQTNINQKVSNLVGYLTTAAAKYEQMVSLSRQLAPLLAEQGISVSSTRGLSAKNKSGGHIPDMVRKAEIQGAFDGGYVPGRVVKSPVGGVMNTAEQVKYYNGFSEPFINPPRNSKAGQNHRSESIKKVGIDPYSFEGFVPNFAIISGRGYKNSEIESRLLKQAEKGNYFNTFYEDYEKALPLTGNDRDLFNKIYASQSYGADDRKVLAASVDLYKNIKSGSPRSVLEVLKEHKSIGLFGGREQALNNFLAGKQTNKTYEYYKALSGDKNALAIDRNVIGTAIGRSTKPGENISSGFRDLLKEKVTKVSQVLGYPGSRNAQAAIFAGRSRFRPTFDVFEQAFGNFSSGFIPNFIPTKLLSGYRKVLGKLKDGEFSLENLSSKEVIESFQNEGKTFKNGPGGFYDRRDDGIRVSTAQPKYGQAHILAHESIHAFLENTGLSEKLEPASRQFARKEPLDVLKNISGVESAIRNNYPKSTYLEEALAEDSLRSSFSKKVINKYLGLSEKQVFKSNKLYNRLHAASIDAIYSNKAEKSSDGFVPNFAKFLGRGAYGSFFDLEKSVGGARIGKKQFNQSGFNHSFEDDIENEYDISKKLSETQNINPLFGFPKVFGSRERSVAANRIGKEVVDGITVKNIGANSGVPFNKVNDVVDPFRFLLDKEVRDKAGVVSGDLNSNNLIANKPLAGIFEKILSVGSKKPDTFSKFVSRLSYKKGLAEQVSKSLASKGGRLSAIDVGLFEKTDNFSDGFVPNFAYKDSVMKLEQGISGRRAVFDTNPFPHIRNASQPTFSAAIQDHGGLNNALRDSVLGQKSAGLLNKGFVPNFAAPNDDFNLSGISPKESGTGQFVKKEPIISAIKGYISSINLFTTSNEEINDKTRSILGVLGLQKKSIEVVGSSALIYANAQRSAAKKIVDSATIKFRNETLEKDRIEEDKSRRKSASVSPISIYPSRRELKEIEAEKLEASRQQAFNASLKNKTGEAEDFAAQKKAEPKTPIVVTERRQEAFKVKPISPIISAQESDRLKELELERIVKTISVSPAVSAQRSFATSVALKKIKLDAQADQAIAKNKSDEKTKLDQAKEKIKSSTFQSGRSVGFESQRSSQVPVGQGGKTSFFGGVKEKLSSQNAGLSLAIGGPLLSGLLEQSVYGNRSRTELSSGERFGKSALGFGVSAAATGASIGSVIAPGIGTLIGGGAGALFGLIGAISDTKLSFEELIQQSDDLRAKNQEQKDAASLYINLIRQRAQLTDTDALERSSLDIRDAFNAIKDVKLHEAFEKAGTDINLLTKSLFDFDKEKRSSDALQSEVAKAQKFSDIGGDTKKLEKDFQYKTETKEAYTVGGRIISPEKTALESGARTEAKVRIDFPNLFRNLNSLSEENAKELQEAFKTQRESIFFDGTKIKSILLKGGTEKDKVQSITDIFEKLSATKNLIGKYFSENLSVDLAKYNKLSKSDNAKQTNIISGQNQFNKFRLATNKLIFDELENANKGLKTFEFDKSIQTLVTEKMQEIGDGMFSSILNGASELGQLSVKQSQIQFASKIQARQIEESLSRAEIDVAVKKNVASNKLQSGLNEVIPETISKSDQGISQIADLLGSAKNGQLSEAKLQSLLNEMFQVKNEGGESSIPGIGNKTQERFIKIQSLVNEYDYVVLASERELEIEKLKIGYAKVLNDISQKTATNQLNLEKKRFAISIAQKNQSNQLALQNGLSGISKNTELESEKIRQGGEFRFLGLDRKQEFVAKQADQQRVFQLEQSIEKEKIAAEVNQSILEIAAQSANTEAIDANTLSNLELVKSNLELKLASEPEAEKGTYSELLDKNNQATIAFKNRNNVASTSLNFSKISGSDNFRDQAAKKREEASLTADPTKKANLEEQAAKLQLAAERIDSSATLLGEKSKQAAADFERSSGFVNNMAIGFSSLSASADDIVNKLGREVPSMFADGIANAITRGITGAQKIGDALRDSAISFGQQIISDLLKASLYKSIGASGIGSLFGAGNQKGGVITAQNGMYISGGRTGDRNLALLEDGEYVLNRNAVKAAGGKGALDQFNFNHAPRFGGRFASGGEFGNLAEIKYATPKGKDAGYDFTNSVLTGNGASQKIDDSNYSAYAYENDQYFIKKREKAVQDLAEKVQRDFVNKQKNAALISTLVGAAGSLTLSAGISQLGKQAALGSQVAQASTKGAITATTPEAQNALTELSNRQLGKFVAANPSAFRLNDASYGTGLNFLAGSKNGLFGFNKLNNLSGALSNSGFNAVKGSGFSFFGQGLNEATGIARRGRQEGGVIGLNGGGYLPHGSRLGDTIPALLTGGEYVLNNTAVKNNGLSKLNAMNAGVVEGKNSSTTNTNNNATNISINIDRSGKTVVGASTNSYEKQDLILTKDMAKSIHAVVLKTISNEKRYNGELYKNPLRN